MGQVEMRHRFRHGEKTMNVIGSGNHRLPDLPGRNTALLHQSDHLRLPLLKRTEIAMQKFFVIVEHVAVGAENHRRWTGAKSRQTNEKLSQRREPSRGIERIGREHWVWSYPFENAVARDHRAIRLTKKRARTRRVSGCVKHAQTSEFKFEFSLIL